MDDPDQVAAYIASVRERELIAPTHEALMARAARVMPSKAHVLDLGCGPGDPIVQLLERRPDICATAVDLSAQMLDSARRLATDSGVLDRIRFVQDDITSLDQFNDASFDGVMSTLALHHLPNDFLLNEATAQINRVMKPGGAIFVADFARMPSEKWMNRFADRDSVIQSDLYRRDFFNSMRAAWSGSEMHVACDVLVAQCTQFITPILPFLQIIATPAQYEVIEPFRSRLRSARAKKTARQLKLWLALGATRKRAVGGRNTQRAA